MRLLRRLTSLNAPKQTPKSFIRLTPIRSLRVLSQIGRCFPITEQGRGGFNWIRFRYRLHQNDTLPRAILRRHLHLRWKPLGPSTHLTQWLCVCCRNRNCVMWRKKRKWKQSSSSVKIDLRAFFITWKARPFEKSMNGLAFHNDYKISYDK